MTLLLPSSPTLESLTSRGYRRFLLENTLESGIRLILQRHSEPMEWPFIDTKFNPNTGEELPAENRQRIYAWFLGRGTEALTLHLEALDQLDLSGEEKAQARILVPRLIENMSAAILEITRRHRGRCPFLLERNFAIVPGWPEPNPEWTGAGDLFCAKGLLLSGDPGIRRQGAAMLEVVADRIQAGQFGLEGARLPAQGLSQGMRMLFLSVPRLVALRNGLESVKEIMFARACSFLAFVLDYHWVPSTGRFSEYVDPVTFEPGEFLDPGHCTEFVGLGLSAVHAMERDGAGMDDARRALFERARREMPDILVSAMKLGFNERHGGMFKAVNHRTGEVIDSEMPWWNMPETMRGAFFAAVGTQNAAKRAACLEVFSKCHNAYFTHYLNPNLMSFPFQTRSGETGQVIDAAPSIPEGDPLYHSNLCFLDILPHLDRGIQAVPNEPLGASVLRKSDFARQLL